VTSFINNDDVALKSSSNEQRAVIRSPGSLEGWNDSSERPYVLLQFILSRPEAIAFGADLYFAGVSFVCIVMYVL